MKDTKLYKEILGLEAPWHVKSVELKAKEKVIEIEVECDEVLWACPKCQERMHRHGSERRRWRHLDTCQFRTIVVCEVPRLLCKEDGTQMVQVHLELGGRQEVYGAIEQMNDLVIPELPDHRAQFVPVDAVCSYHGL